MNNDLDPRIQYEELVRDPMLVERLHAEARRRRASEGGAFIASVARALVHRIRDALRPVARRARATGPCGTVGAAPCA